MSKENKRRPLVFTPSEVEQPKTESTEDLDVLLAETPPVVDETPSVEVTPEKSAPEPEAPSVEVVLPFGWRVLGLAQQDGRTYPVAVELEAEGVRAYWRKTRAMSHNKWVLHGKWTDRLTNVDLLPQPRYYKDVQ